MVDLANPSVRGRMVAEARWLVAECGLAGVQWDYEVCPDGDPSFLSLMRETRAALPDGALLSAAVPTWLPPPLQRWGWSEAYFGEVAGTCDQLAVMCYDTGMVLPRAYSWLAAQQVPRVTRAVAAANPRCGVLIGLPTYARGGASHHAPAENIRMALKGIRDGLRDPRARLDIFRGVAPFADYTTQPQEWAVYRRLWLDEAPVPP